MSDTSETETPEAASEEAETAPEDEVKKWKALARENEKRAKANAEAAKKLAEIEDANKTELEKANTAAAEAAKRAEEAEARALRLEVASEKGLDGKQAKYLTGATREELEANADQILEDFAPAKKPSDKLPARPKPKAGGAVDDPRELTGKERAAAAFRQFSAR